MTRRCERPDCASVAAVAYSFDPRRRVVYFDQLRGSVSPIVGALCLHHADTMVLPKGWWLDDRRVEVPTLFRQRPAAGERSAPLPAASTPMPPPVAPAPAGTGASASDEATAPAAPRRTVRRRVGTSGTSGTAPLPLAATAAAASAPGGDDVALEEWSPQFDATDDLDGLLDAQTPLLSRAFGQRRRGQRS